MNYEIIEMEEKTVIGIATVTNNASPDMGSKIGQLWQKLYSGTVEKMIGRVNGKCIGLYCDYQQNGDYTVLAGCEIEKSAAEKNKDAETTVNHSKRKIRKICCERRRSESCCRIMGSNLEHSP